jgi:hypothetical protein
MNVGQVWVIFGNIVLWMGLLPPTGAVVRKPRLRNTLTNSLFCTGFEREATKRSPGVGASIPVYALTLIIGVFVFLLFVLLIYCAAASPSTVMMYEDGSSASNGLLTDGHIEVQHDHVKPDVPLSHTDGFRAVGNHNASTSHTR